MQPLTVDATSSTAVHADVALADRVRAVRERILTELRKIIVGQDAVIEETLVALFAGGHCLIVGVPGLAKTLLVQSLAQALDLKFQRIQFTPDLMPSDITGTDIIQEDPASGRRDMVFMPGPVFANILLADEINRTPPKTQAALLEAMQEKRVTVQGRTYTLEPPFFVFATQNPIELEGTYPLPEAQLDRFMFQIHIGYSSADEELSIVKETTSIKVPELARVVSGGDIVKLQNVVRQVPVADAVANYAIALARASRPGPSSPDFIRDWVAYGVSVRAAQFLVLGGKARALLHGRLHVNFDDIVALAHPVLRHRILLNFRAQSERVTTDAIIDKLLAAVPRPASGL